MDDILVVDEDLVDINCDGNRQSDNKKGKHSSGGRMAKGEKKSKKKLAIIISSVAAVAVALGVAGFCIFGGNLFNSVEEAIAGEFKFPDGTTVSGVSISGKTYDEAKKALEEKEESFIKPLDISNILMTLSLYLMKSKMKQPIRLLKLQQAKRVTR